jgi:general secretion pathway protein B
MSYILEALKKSERERGHGCAPGIQTIHSSSLNYHANKRQLWPWILTGVVSLNLGALLYFALAPHPENRPPSASTALVQNRSQQNLTQPPAPAVTVAGSDNTDTAHATSSAADNDLQSAAVSDNSTPGVTLSPPLANDAAFGSVSELPAALQSQVPLLEFSAHVYSSNPRQRSVVINGRFMEQGERLNEDFILDEITTTGVIMIFRGYRYHANVIGDWSVR